MPKHLLKWPRRVECTTFYGITEAGAPHSRVLIHAILIYLPWHGQPEALPCWTEDFTCPAAHLDQEILPCKMLTDPLPTVLSPRPVNWDSGTGVHYPPLIAVCVCVIFLLDCYSVSRILMYVDVLLWVNLHSIRAEWIAQLLCVTLVYSLVPGCSAGS